MKKQQLKEEGKKQQAAVWLVLFALSGAAALIYEIVWIRQFTRVLGASSYAVTIILAAFMAGLGLGAWFFGKRADGFDGKKLIKAYVLLEAGIAGYAVLLPLLLCMAEGVYVVCSRLLQNSQGFLNALRLALAFTLLIIPTACMGATLPVMSRYLIRSRKVISVTISKLYAMNTLGAIIGTVCAGYVLLPELGIWLTTLIAVVMNLVVAAAVWYAGGAQRPVDAEEINSMPKAFGETPSPGLTGLQKAALLGFCFSGATAMFYEVAWTRTLCMILGTTTFAFTTMLSTFLAGIALGSAVYGAIPASVSRSRLFTGLQFVIAFSVLCTIPLFDKLPLAYLYLHGRWGETWLDVQYIRFMLAALVMLLPTLAMGTMLPVVSSLFIETTGHLGSRLGRAYGFNTIGNVAGAVIAGLLLVPAVGMQKTIMIGAFLNLAAGSFVLMQMHGVTRRFRGVGIAGAVLLAVIICLRISPWSAGIMNSGVYVYAPQYHSMLERYNKVARADDTVPEMPAWQVWKTSMEQFKTLYYKAGPVATVAVMERSDGVRFLTINGKTDASTGEKSDMRTQVMIGQLPMLFHKSPDKALVVGLGSGVTVGSVLTHNVRVVDCLEIAPAVIEGARFFANYNNNALSDSRLRILPQDARNYLLTSDERYEVIISQPSNPWISGESELFSLEWYRIVSSHLKDGGLFLQWIPSYCISEQNLKIIMHTLRSVFPGITVWTTGSAGDLVLLASKAGPLQIDYQELLAKAQRKQVKDDIARVGLDPAMVPFELFVMGEQQLPVYLYSQLASELPRNTDNMLITEFSTPRQMFARKNAARFLDPEFLRGDPKAILDILRNIDIEQLNELLQKKIQIRKNTEV